MPSVCVPSLQFTCASQTPLEGPHSDSSALQMLSAVLRDSSVKATGEQAGLCSMGQSGNAEI